MKTDENSVAASPAAVNATVTRLDKLLATAIPILQGLLATGLYHAEGEDYPDVRNHDNGKDWKECGCPRRWTSYVVEDAIDLAKELIEHSQFFDPTDPAS